MGSGDRAESQSDVVRFGFDCRRMLQFRGSVLTSDAELLGYCELDDAFRLTTMAAETLADARSQATVATIDFR